MPWRHIKNLHIALIGCGKMGGALLRSWLETGIAAQVDVFDPADISVSHAGIHHYRDIHTFPNPCASAPWDIVILAVKPASIKPTCLALKPFLSPDIPVLSIAAGVKLATLAAVLHAGQPLIRAMPNTPAAVGKGMTVMVTHSNTSAEHMHRAQALVTASGAVEWIDDETLMDAVTAVSGSGPAYVFYLIETLAKAGETAGLPRDLAMRIARQTVIGAGALAEHDTETPADILRENVTSPGGTTHAALSVLRDGRWQEILNDAVKKATDRSVELSG